MHDPFIDLFIYFTFILLLLFRVIIIIIIIASLLLSIYLFIPVCVTHMGRNKKREMEKGVLITCLKYMGVTGSSWLGLQLPTNPNSKLLGFLWNIVEISTGEQKKLKKINKINKQINTGSIHQKTNHHHHHHHHHPSEIFRTLSSSYIEEDINIYLMRLYDRDNIEASTRKSKNNNNNNKTNLSTICINQKRNRKMRKYIYIYI
eukprot:gene8021-5576_t